MAIVAVKVLSLLSPANRMMQAKSCNIILAAELVTSANAALTQMRSEKQLEKFATEAGMKKDDRATCTTTTKTKQASGELLHNFRVSECLLYGASTAKIH